MAQKNLDKYANIPFGTLFADKLNSNKANKGRTGQWVEERAGIKASSRLLDCEDGELKTFPKNDKGNPKETVAITQISKHINDLYAGQKYEDSHLYEKTSKICFTPIVKADKDVRNWYIEKSFFYDANDPKFAQINADLEADYYYICRKIREYVDSGKNIHTISGKYLQIRTKDTRDKNGNYHPLYIEEVARYVSNKNYAFFFKKKFMIDVEAIALSSN